MIVYLQMLPIFGKFCFYGCYCFAAGPFKLLQNAGSGAPMDAPDSACRRHGRCNMCANRDFGEETCDQFTPYGFEAKQDPVTGEKYIKCRKYKHKNKKPVLSFLKERAEQNMNF
jgi:hypothetical protein